MSGSRETKSKDPAESLNVIAEQLRVGMDRYNSMRQSAERIASGIAQMHQQLSDVASQVSSGIKVFQERIAELATLVEPILRNLVEAFQSLPERMQRAVMTLAQEGWFVSPDLPVSGPIDAAIHFASGERDTGNGVLVAYFESNLRDIENTLTNALPHRVVLIRAAFAAHRRREYELSIPVLLSQADGVCFDLAKASLFQSMRAQGRHEAARPATAVYVDAMGRDAFWTALLSPLGQKIPINYSAGERGQSFQGLNRHLIMHGESLDYGTRINSLKCISLLSYAAWVLRTSREKLATKPKPVEE